MPLPRAGSPPIKVTQTEHRRLTLPSLHLPSQSMTVAKRLISRTVLAKVYANDKCARRLYSHSPVLPDKPLGPSKESIWRRSSRPTIPEYVQGLVHYELAVEGDVPNVIKFWETKIGEQSPLLNSIGAKPSELLDFITPVISRSVKEHCSLLGFVGDELVGFSLHSIHDVSSTKEDVVLPEIVPSKDYSAEIDAAPYNSRPAKKMSVFWNLLSQNSAQLVPGAKRIMFIELGGVAPDFQQRGISQEMIENGMKLAKEKFNCDHVQVVADSKASQKLYETKLGFHLCRELKLDHFFDGPANAFPYEKNEIFSGKLLAKKL